MKVLDLFSGIGGFSLGLEKAGMEIIAFCEIEKFCKNLLRQRWPHVPIFEDVKTICRWTWKNSKAQISLRQVFHARIFHSLEKVPEYPGSVQISSGKYAVPFAWYDHPSRCWRTWQRCLIGEWEPYLEPWPRSGMTRNGIAYRLPILAPLTKGIESGYWATPTTMDHMKPKTDKAALKEATQTRKGRKKWANLRDQVARGREIYPTPVGRDCRSGSKADWKGRQGARSLSDKIALEGNGGLLNPEFVEWLMGYPAGWTELKPSEIP